MNRDDWKRVNIQYVYPAIENWEIRDISMNELLTKVLKEFI